MPNRVLFIDPRLSHVAGGAERLTMEKIKALDPNRFAVSILTRGDRQPNSALFRAFRQARPDVDVITLPPPVGTKGADFRDFVTAHQGQALIGKDPTVDDAICFNVGAKRIVECGDWDLVSCSFLTDLFGLESNLAARDSLSTNTFKVTGVS